MTTYYNEWDPFAAAWLRELIRSGQIPDGEVDERDIKSVQPDDLRGFHHVHMFAGIGGWAYALRLARWPDDLPCWTGSAPCQPYSSAGKGEGADDPRNLWPHWFRLIRECRPPVVLGEQVEAAVRHGWLDAVSTDLEAEDYAFGAAVLGAHSVGAPHIRQRAFFVAESGLPGHHGAAGAAPVSGSDRSAGRLLERGGDPGGLADHDGRGCEVGTEQHGAAEQGPADRSPRRAHARGCGGPRFVAYADGGQPGDGDVQRRGQHGQQPEGARSVGAWSDLKWLHCRDGKARPTQPGIFPLAHGVPNRVGTLRGAGNAIVPQVAAEFIAAYREAVSA